MTKFLRRILTAVLIVACALTATFVYAAVQIFDGRGEWHTNDDDNQQIAKQRAQQRAQLDAQKKAGVYLKTFSRTVDLELVEDEVTAVTANILELVGDVHFDKKIIPLSDQSSTILYTATLKAKIDPDGLFDWFKRDEKQKVNDVRQNSELQDAIRRNDEQAAVLTEQYTQAATQSERDELRRQIDEVDRDFLANQKLEEGLKLNYAEDYNGAIRLYNEALDIKPDYPEAYTERGVAQFLLGQIDQAFDDFAQAIELNPNYARAYYCNGYVYDELEQYETAIRNYDKAVNLDPKYFEAYGNRGVAYIYLQQYHRALNDFNTALKINPNYFEGYANRGICYNDGLKDYGNALTDFNTALKLNPYSGETYNNRGEVYMKMERYERAIQDFTKALEFLEHPMIYTNRGKCYQALGDEAKAQADFDKARQLGDNG